MKRISKAIILALVMVASFHCLHIQHFASHLQLPESPSELSGLSADEEKIKSKLAVVNLQIAATNNTIAKYLYKPVW